MNSPGRQSFVSRLIRWKYLFVVNIILILLIGFSFGREFFRSHEIQKEIHALQAQADALSTRNASLTQLQTAIQTQSFIEREARLKLGMKKPGEDVVIIPEVKNGDGKPGGAGPGSAAASSDPLGLVIDGKSDKLLIANPTKWWNYFFNKSAFKAIASYEN
ncbi:MAG: septum formation initiator family protein [Patescibacteria group bacterium]